MKTLDVTKINSARTAIPDLNVYGDGDMFRLICKASSKSEGWMKSTKAMEIPGVGCVIQVTTQQGDNVAEALTFVPGVRIEGLEGNDRRIVAMGAINSGSLRLQCSTKPQRADDC